MNGILSVWVITWRLMWPAILVALLLPAAVLAAGRWVPSPPVRAFTLALVAPVLAVAWSGALWGAERSAGASVRWASWILGAIVIAGIAVSIGLPMRFRNVPKRWLIVLNALANGVFLLGAGFVGSMAISDSWL